MDMRDRENRYSHAGVIDVEIPCICPTGSLGTSISHLCLLETPSAINDGL